MSKKYLVAVDGSEHGWKATDLAASLAKASDAELILLHVISAAPLPDEGVDRWAEVEGVNPEEMRARYREGRSIGDVVIREAEARVRDSGFSDVSTEVAEGNVASNIVEHARTVGADMIFLGSHGLSDIQGLLLGSVSHKVMHLAPCTCVVVR